MNRKVVILSIGSILLIAIIIAILYSNYNTVDFNIEPSPKWEDAQKYYDNPMDEKEYGLKLREIFYDKESDKEILASVNGVKISRKKLDLALLEHYYSYSYTKRQLEENLEISDDVRQELERKIEDEFIASESETLRQLVDHEIMYQLEEEENVLTTDEEILSMFEENMKLAKEDAANGGESSIRALKEENDIFSSSGLSKEEFVQTKLFKYRLTTIGNNLRANFKESLPEGDRDNDDLVTEKFNEYVDNKWKEFDIKTF